MSVLIEVSLPEFIAAYQVASRANPKIAENCTPTAGLVAACAESFWAFVNKPSVSAGSLTHKDKISVFYSTVCRVFLSKDGNVTTGGFVVLDGVLRNLFVAVPNGQEFSVGSWLLQRAEGEGAQHLDCFDGYLTEWYKARGWKETKRDKNWDAGGPDVVYMHK